jgi:hypothetical protein
MFVRDQSLWHGAIALPVHHIPHDLGAAAGVAIGVALGAACWALILAIAAWAWWAL